MLKNGCHVMAAVLVWGIMIIICNIIIKEEFIIKENPYYNFMSGCITACSIFFIWFISIKNEINNLMYLILENNEAITYFDIRVNIVTIYTNSNSYTIHTNLLLLICCIVCGFSIGLLFRYLISRKQKNTK